MISSVFSGMIHNLIFDFGGVLINLDLEAVPVGLRKFGLDIPGPELIRISQRYEKGLMPTGTFLEEVHQVLKGSQIEEVRQIWNQTIGDFPIERLQFLEELKRTGRYRMFLLSNTNALHIQQVRLTMGREIFDRFYACFHGFYLSHEIGMRKPDPEIFEYVMQENKLLPGETLFIDDTREHTESASGLGLHTWHLKVGKEDIRQLYDKLD